MSSEDGTIPVANGLGSITTTAPTSSSTTAGSTTHPVAAGPSHASTHLLALEDVQRIAGAVADMLRSSSVSSPLTVPPTSSAASCAPPTSTDATDSLAGNF